MQVDNSSYCTPGLQRKEKMKKISLIENYEAVIARSSQGGRLGSFDERTSKADIDGKSRSDAGGECGVNDIGQVEDENDEQEHVVEVPVKRGRGRPRKDEAKNRRRQNREERNVVPKRKGSRSRISYR